MAKLQWIKFDIQAWRSEPTLWLASANAYRAWHLTCCELWDHGVPRMTHTVREWSVLWHSSEADATAAILELKERKVGPVTLANCDISVTPQDKVTESNALVTIGCRRLLREDKTRQGNRIRQQEHRNRLSRNATGNADVTLQRREEKRREEEIREENTPSNPPQGEARQEIMFDPEAPLPNAPDGTSELEFAQWEISHTIGHHDSLNKKLIAFRRRHLNARLGIMQENGMYKASPILAEGIAEVMRMRREGMKSAGVNALFNAMDVALAKGHSGTPEKSADEIEMSKIRQEMEERFSR